MKTGDFIELLHEKTEYTGERGEYAKKGMRGLIIGCKECDQLCDVVFEEYEKKTLKDFFTCSVDKKDLKIIDVSLRTAKMKEYDAVMLMKDKEAYKQSGVVKGMQGVIMDSRSLNGCWWVIFEGEYYQYNGIWLTEDLPCVVQEEDLKLLTKEEINQAYKEYKKKYQ